MTLRYRQIFPGIRILMAVTLIYLLVEVGSANKPFPDAHRGRFFVYLLAALYGAYRVVGFHPLFWQGYRGWLVLTPWTSAFPLPLGPIGFVWEDAFILGYLSLPSLFSTRVEPSWIFGNAMFAASGVLALTFLATGQRGFSYAIALLLGLTLRVSPDRWAFLIAAAFTYLVAFVGLRRSLAAFPWPAPWSNVFNTINNLNTPILHLAQGPSCGWPFDFLRPPSPPLFRFDFLDALLTSMLLGWWVFAVAGLFDDPRERGIIATLACVFCSFFMIPGRAFIYTRFHVPPVGVWTRLVTRRFIIPSYDQVFIAPTCATFIALATPTGLMALGVTSEVASPVTLSLVMLAVLTIKPSLHCWKLTGGHRIVPAVRPDKYVRVG